MTTQHPSALTMLLSRHTRLQSALRRWESLPALSATLLGGLLGARGGTSGESWPLKPQFRPYRNAHLHISHAAQRPADRPAKGRRSTLSRPQCLVLLILDT